MKYLKETHHISPGHISNISSTPIKLSSGKISNISKKPMKYLQDTHQLSAGHP